MRSERNRLARESEAVRLGADQPERQPRLEEIGPVLDDVLCELSDKDREAIIERYFSDQSYAAIGAKLRLTENAARMRVERALQRMRGSLERRGIASTALALAAALPSYASSQEPAGLAVSIAKASVIAAAGGVGGSFILTYMTTTKIIAAFVMAAAVGGFVWEKNRNGDLQKELAETQTQLSSTNESLHNIESKVHAIEEAESKRVSAAALVQHVAATKKPEHTPGITPEAPNGWHKNGSAVDAYEVGVDSNNSWGGMPSAYAKSVADAKGQFGGMMQTIAADAYRGQRVQLTGWLKTQDVDGSGNLWMRIDGKGSGNILQFDNMNGRAPKGTTDWQEYSLVLDVPEDATKVNYGFFLGGKGQLWVNGVTITPVGNQVPNTNMESTAKLPAVPVNLGFAAQNGTK